MNLDKAVIQVFIGGTNQGRLIFRFRQPNSWNGKLTIQLADAALIEELQRHQRGNPDRIVGAGGTFMPEDPTTNFDTLMRTLGWMVSKFEGMTYKIQGPSPFDEEVKVSSIDNRSRIRTKGLKIPADLP